MLAIEQRVKEINGCKPGDLPDFVLSSTQPILLKGYGSHWPVVQAAKKSPKNAADYLRKHYNGNPVISAYGEPHIKGRVFYNEDMTGFNCQGIKANLNRVLDKIFTHKNETASKILSPKNVICFQRPKESADGTPKVNEAIPAIVTAFFLVHFFSSIK